MYRQSPGRNNRSKRLKMRHVLQICLLLAVCFWLIYQVRHSHDKKKEYDGSDDEKASLERGVDDELIRFGRKDIRPLVEEIDDKTERHDEAAEEDESKLEEDDEENKLEHNVDDVTQGENEETDEHEQEKSDAELDREEEFFVDDENEKEENGDNVFEETISDAEKHQLEKEDSAVESDSDGVDKSAHEAREEHYKADDASSAVSQATQTKNDIEHPKDMLEVDDNNGSDGEDGKSENGKDLTVETVKDDHHGSNVTTSLNSDLLFDSSENGSPPNGTTTTQVSEDIVAKNNTTIENVDLSSQNVTESEDKLDHGANNLLNETTAAKEVSFSDVTASENSNSSLHEDGNKYSLVSNSTSKLETSRDTESNSEHEPENIITSKASTDTESSAEKNDATEGERSDTSGNTVEENSESTDEERHGEAENDAIDISDSISNPLEEETNARTDLDTLPEIQTELVNDDDDGAAAE